MHLLISCMNGLKSTHECNAEDKVQLFCNLESEMCLNLIMLLNADGSNSDAQNPTYKHKIMAILTPQ